MLAAGLDGIRHELPVPDATEENIYLEMNDKKGIRSERPSGIAG